LKAIVVALGGIGGGFAQADPAGAQSAQQLKWCNGDGHPTPDLSIDGSTALIRSGKYSGRGLAIACTNRGSSYDDRSCDPTRTGAVARHGETFRAGQALAWPIGGGRRVHYVLCQNATKSESSGSRVMGSNREYTYTTPPSKTYEPNLMPLLPKCSPH
jgi:hypothetical protein